MMAHGLMAFMGAQVGTSAAGSRRRLGGPYAPSQTWCTAIHLWRSMVAKDEAGFG